MSVEETVLSQGGKGEELHEQIVFEYVRDIGGLVVAVNQQRVRILHLSHYFFLVPVAFLVPHSLYHSHLFLDQKLLSDDVSLVIVHEITITAHCA